MDPGMGTTLDVHLFDAPAPQVGVSPAMNTSVPLGPARRRTRASESGAPALG